MIFWEEVPETIDRWVEKTSAPAQDIRQRVAGIYTRGDLGYYWDPETEMASLFGREATAQDLALGQSALARAVGEAHVRSPLSFSEVASGDLVKVAYSPTLRRLGELLNFFPGKYPGGIPNAPSPLAATLTGGLVGAGIGYGAGYLGERLLPKDWDRKRLRRSGAMLGGLAGAAPGALWAYSALRRGKSLRDGSDLAQSPGSAPIEDFQDLRLKQAMDVLEKLPLGERYREAVEKFASMFSTDFLSAPGSAPTVNIDRMGQTLWNVGASPQLAATTMGSLYAAQQLPDPDAKPGRVTARQTGLLGTAMGAAGGGAKGYAAGWGVGKALGVIAGMPIDTQRKLRQSGALLGAINAVVPRLFG